MNNINKIKELVKQIQNLFYKKDYFKIIKETKKAVNNYPNISIFYNLLGLALTQIGKFHEAKIILEKGHKLNQDDLAIINNLANANKKIFEYELAEKLYKLSISKQKNYVNAYVNYGNLKRDLNKFEEAISLYKQALNYEARLPTIYYLLSMAYQSLGNFREADNFAYKTIELDKKFTKADLLISRSKKYTRDDNHLKQMREKLDDSDLNSQQKIDLYFALSKASEDLGDMQECFNYLEKGNKLKRESVKFSINSQKNTFKQIKDVFSKINFKKFQKNNSNNKRIIFILGMPRSGTTLVEQIMSAHTNVYGSGELPYLTEIIKKKFNIEESSSTPDIVKILGNSETVTEISDEYYSYLRSYGISENNITDKAPLNFMWIGFIKILFPNSKIIHCERNPKDNCVSLYKNVFEGGINFCYTQEELAEFYNLYLDLMKFWQSSLPNDFLNIKYEEIINNPEIEIKKMLDYCDLNWEENCLNFSNNKTPIKTASIGQARNSIYSTSVKSFTRYEIFLSDLFRSIQKKSPR